MTRSFLLLLSLFIAFSSCKKTVNTTSQAATDNTLILTYLADNQITATKDPSGLYYEIINPGTGPNPTTSSTITVTYTGSLINGGVFAPTANLTAQLSTLIQGWQIGIPHIAAGGTILLLVPSVLGYGSSTNNANIPANSVLIFSITLQSFTN